MILTDVKRHHHHRRRRRRRHLVSHRWQSTAVSTTWRHLERSSVYAARPNRGQRCAVDGQLNSASRFVQVDLSGFVSPLSGDETFEGDVGGHWEQKAEYPRRM